MKNILLLWLFAILISPAGFAQEYNFLEPDEEPPGQTIQIDVGEKTHIELGGAIWVQTLFSAFNQRESSARKGIHVSQFRIAANGYHDPNPAKDGKWIFSAQMRVFNYMTMLNHGWVGYEFNENHRVEFGATQVPFGILPSTSNSFWYSTGWYHALEDDTDAGVKYRYTKGPVDVHLAYFMNEEYNDASRGNRFAPDLFNDGGLQQNEEEHQFNGRFAYTLGKGTKNTTILGVSGEYGGIENRITLRRGNHWQAAAHLNGNYGRWNVKAQFARFEWNPQNPEGVDDNLVLMNFWESSRLIAAKGNAMTLALKRHFDTGWEALPKLEVYLDYSRIFKDEASFFDSELLNPGFVLQVGPVYFWNDFIFARNGWWMNDSFENPGHGPGGINPTKW